jgi:hypothetical protein
MARSLGHSPQCPAYNYNVVTVEVCQFWRLKAAACDVLSLRCLFFLVYFVSLLNLISKFSIIVMCSLCLAVKNVEMRKPLRTVAGYVLLHDIIVRSILNICIRVIYKMEGNNLVMRSTVYFSSFCSVILITNVYSIT